MEQRQQKDKVKKFIFKDCPSFTNCIRKAYNTQADNATDLDVEMAMYNLLKYSNYHWKGSRNLWDKTDLDKNANFIDFNGDSTTDLFKFRGESQKLPMMLIQKAWAWQFH